MHINIYWGFFCAPNLETCGPVSVAIVPVLRMTATPGKRERERDGERDMCVWYVTLCKAKGSW